MEVKSRDIGSTISTPSKRKSKKKSEATTSQASSSSSEAHIQTTIVHASSAMNFKSILGVSGTGTIPIPHIFLTCLWTEVVLDNRKLASGGNDNR
ncbi:hypothetical protein S83_009246, partial [Arachis hypogaea]